MLGIETEREASCPSVAPLICMEEEIAPHQQHAQLVWMRISPKISVGLADGWKISLGVPMNMRWFDVSYLQSDGGVFEPAYATESGSDKWIQGVGDPVVVLSKIGRWSGWVGAIGSGVSFPMGNIEDTPYSRNQLGSLQQYAQMGTGAVQPVLTLKLIREENAWRGFVSARMTFSLYANANGYQPPSVYMVDVGASRKIGSRLDGWIGLNFDRTSKDYWDGVAYPGREGLNAKFGMTTHLGLNWFLEAQAQVLLKEGLLGAPTGEMMTERGSFTLGASWKN